MATEYFAGLQFDHISGVIYSSGNYDSLQAAIEDLDGIDARLWVVDSDTLSSLGSGDYSGVTLEIQPQVVVTNQVSDPGFSVLVYDGGQFAVDEDTTLPYARAIAGDSGITPYVAVDGDETLTVLNSPGITYSDKFGSSLTVSAVESPDSDPPSDPTNFTAYGNQGFINLKWDHGGESDLSYFTIYRHTSDSFSDSSIIGTVNGLAGTQAEFLDSPPTEEIYYYWVSATDTSGNESGVAGSVSASAKFSFVSPEAFGAKGDGVNNDSMALQSAFDDGRAIWMDKGAIYAVDSTVTKTFYDDDSGVSYTATVGLLLGSDTVIYGNNAEIKATTSMDILIGFKGRCGELNCRGLELNCNGLAKTGWMQNDNPTHPTWSPYLHLSDIRVSDFTEYGFVISTFVSHFDRLEAAGNSPGWKGIVVASPGWYIRGKNGNDDPSGLAATSLTMNSCWGHKCSSAGIELHGITYSSLNSCASDDNNAGYWFRGKLQGVTLNGCGAERSSQALVADCGDHEITMTISAFQGWNICATSSTDSSWLDSDPAFYFFTFSGKVGAIFVSGVSISTRNDPQNAHYKVKDDGSGAGLQLLCNNIIVDYRRLIPTATVWPDSTAKSIDGVDIS